jgi:hypothetical protein
MAGISIGVLVQLGRVIAVFAVISMLLLLPLLLLLLIILLLLQCARVSMWLWQRGQTGCGILQRNRIDHLARRTPVLRTLLCTLLHHNTAASVSSLHLQNALCMRRCLDELGVSFMQCDAQGVHVAMQLLHARLLRRQHRGAGGFPTVAQLALGSVRAHQVPETRQPSCVRLPQQQGLQLLAAARGQTVHISGSNGGSRSPQCSAVDECQQRVRIECRQ